MARFSDQTAFNRHRRLRCKVLKRDGYTCKYCGCRLTRCDVKLKPRPATAATVDHVVPLAKGGQTEATNLVACCHACNTRKGAMAPSFLQGV